MKNKLNCNNFSFTFNFTWFDQVGSICYAERV